MFTGQAIVAIGTSILEASVEVDGELIQQNERYVDRQVREQAGSFNAAGY